MSSKKTNRLISMLLAALLITLFLALIKHWPVESQASAPLRLSQWSGF